MRGASRGYRRSPEQDAAWRRAVEEARQRHNITDVVARSRKVIRAGRERKALCAFHDERSPSMQLNDAKGTFHCFGCGAGGDIIAYVMHEQGVGFIDALRWLGQADLPLVDPAHRARAAAEDAAERASAIADARELWAEGVSIEGTPGETYLRQARGIAMPLPASLRFGLVPTSRDDAGHWKRPYPAVLCACTGGPDGDLLGLQRIFIRDDGRDKRWGKRSKLSIGRPKAAAFKLAPAAHEVVICEGPEDGLSLAQELPDRAVWVALGTAMMPEVTFPPAVRRVCIAGQNDNAGRAAVDAAAAALGSRGLDVRTMFPDPAFKDWNDQLRGVRA